MPGLVLSWCTTGRFWNVSHSSLQRLQKILKLFPSKFFIVGLIYALIGRCVKSAQAHFKAREGHLGLEDGSELLGDGVTDLSGAGAAANVFGADVVVDDGLDGLVDLLGKLGLLEGVLEHHAHGEDGGDGVDDALARDVGGGACGTSVSGIILMRG